MSIFQKIWIWILLLFGYSVAPAPAPAPAPIPVSDTIWSITGVHDNKPFIVSASKFHGGAIYSLIWNGIEFINATDNGRELQTAWQLNHKGVDYNPTEAGAGSDNPAVGSTTIVGYASDAGNVLTTNAQLANWTPYEGQAVSNTGLQKTVTLGYKGLTNVLRHQLNIVLDKEYSHLLVEGLTSYSPQNFIRFFSYDPETNIRIEVPPPSGMVYEMRIPYIIATADLSHAIALWANFGTFSYGGAPDGVSLWPKLVCAVFEKAPAVGNYAYETFTIFGTLDQVTNSLAVLTKG